MKEGWSFLVCSHMVEDWESGAFAKGREKDFRLNVATSPQSRIKETFYFDYFDPEGCLSSPRPFQVGVKSLPNPVKEVHPSLCRSRAWGHTSGSSKSSQALSVCQQSKFPMEYPFTLARSALLSTDHPSVSFSGCCPP